MMGGAVAQIGDSAVHTWSGTARDIVFAAAMAFVLLWPLVLGAFFLWYLRWSVGRSARQERDRRRREHP
jgi:hypothetical protein